MIFPHLAFLWQVLSQPCFRQECHVENSLIDGGFGIVMSVRRAEERSSLQKKIEMANPHQALLWLTILSQPSRR